MQPPFPARLTLTCQPLFWAQCGRQSHTQPLHHNFKPCPGSVLTALEVNEKLDSRFQVQIVKQAAEIWPLHPDAIFTCRMSSTEDHR